MGFKKWWKSEPTPADDGARGPLPDEIPGDWVVIPFRVMEALRVSLATVGAHPELPEGIRLWVADWLLRYNQSLAAYMGEVYGPDIFPILDGITAMVRSYSDQYYAKESEDKSEQDMEEFFKFVEKELSDGGDPPPSSPPTS